MQFCFTAFPEDLPSFGTGRFGREEAVSGTTPATRAGLTEREETSFYGTLHGCPAEE